MSAFAGLGGLGRRAAWRQGPESESRGVVPRSGGAGAACALVVGLLFARPAAAQLPLVGPPGPYVIDVRGVTSGLPSDPAFFPAVPAGTVVPTRGAGIDVGGHVYLFRLGAARVGVGANLMVVHHQTAGGTASGAGASAAGANPDVAATLTTLAPQVSFNFGSADGWSYLSAGVGMASVTAETSGTATPESRESGRLSSINAGGGARWFWNRHLAVGFDVRFHVVSRTDRAAPLAGTPRTMLVAASAGISLR